ncbi:HECA [Branchiostoma lanceolatum]|uniref:HECA protein n=1 Tax=Branchiostoma lanceolatum TaxID=7740 RepID=A0A8S4MMQ6_BRALA|nr:HECA [Branchiostoma lanceolatum]
MPKGGGKVRKRQDSASSGAGDGGGSGETEGNQSAGSSSTSAARAGSLERGCCHPVHCSSDDPLDLVKNAVKVICSNENCPESSYMHDRCFDKWEDSVLDHLSCAPRIVTGRFLRWPKEKRRESLWTIRGYDLVKKAHVEVCKCKCGKGYLRKDTEWRPEEDTSIKKKKQKKGGSSQQQEQQQQKQQHKQHQQKENHQQHQQKENHQQQPPAQQQQQQVKQAKPSLNHPVVKWPAPYMLPISERSTPPIPEHYIPGLNLKEEQNGQKKKKKKKRSRSGKSETSSQNSSSKPPSPDDELILEDPDVEEAVETVDKEGGAVEQLVELGFSRQGIPPEDPITAISVKVLTDMGFTNEQSYKAIKEHGTVEAALNSLITSAFNQSGSLDTEVYMSDEEDFPENLSPPKQNHSMSAFQPVVPRAPQVAPRLVKSAMFAPAAAQAPIPQVSFPKQQSTFSMRPSAPVTARPAAPKAVAMNGHHNKASGATPTPCAALWVGNITSKISQADLQTIFGKYGRILSIKIIHNKTCAFVNFTNMADATRARDGLQGTEVGGMELVIRFPDNPIINADGNFLMMKSKLKTGNSNQTGGQAVAKVSQAQSSNQQGKMKGPVETEFGEECFFYRTTGCHFGKNCSHLHIPHHKGVDL